MEKPPLWQTTISAKERKRQYLQLIEEMRERWTRQLKGRERDIQIKEMHVHMKDIKLEQQEEEFREREEAIKKIEEEALACERELEERMKKSRNDY
jgi:uncharacterized protein (DUF3084 family)